MQQIVKPTPTDLFLICFTALIWATAFGSIKVVVDQVGPIWLATFRASIGFLAILPFYFFSKRSKGLSGISKSEWQILLCIATFNLIYPFVAISWGLQSIDSGVAALLMGCGPIFALIIAHYATPDERMSPLKILAVLLGISGLFILIGPQALKGFGTGALLGHLAVVSGSISYVIAGIFIRRLSLEAITSTLLALGIGALALSVIAVIIEGMPPTPNIKAKLFLLWLGVFPTGLAYLLRFHLVRRVGMSTFSIGVNLTPIFGVIIGVVLLGEELTWQILTAVSLVIAALFVARMSSNNIPTNPKDNATQSK